MIRSGPNGSVILGSIPSPVKPMTLKLLFTASQLDAQQRDNVENQLASLIVEPLGKTLSGITHLRVVDRRSVTPKRTRYSALIASA